jgi:hypothetical protein
MINTFGEGPIFLEIGLAFVDWLGKRIKSDKFADTQVTQSVDTIRQFDKCALITKDLNQKLID